MIPRIVTALLLASLVAAPAVGQVQTRDQQKCINAINKAAAKLAATQAKENQSCLKNAGRGDIAGFEACITNDAKGRIAKAIEKLDNAFRKCDPFGDFGVGVGNDPFAAPIDGTRSLLDDLIGTESNRNLVDCESDGKDACRCQQSLLREADKLAATHFKLFSFCLKRALAEKKTPFLSGATSAADVQACIDDALVAESIVADSKDKLAKAYSKVLKVATKKCADKDVAIADALGGDCALTSMPATLAACIDTKVRCRTCQMLNDTAGIAADCDALDDGFANASCGSTAVVPTPTPTPTATPTPVPTANCAVDGGFAFAGTCWFYGSLNQTCAARCAAEGLSYDQAGTTAANDDSFNICRPVLLALDPSTSGAGAAQSCSFFNKAGVGCHRDFCTGSFPDCLQNTTDIICTDGDPTSTARKTTVRRACACRSFS